MSTYDDLQEMHQELLTRHESGEDPLAMQQAVLDYIKRVRDESNQVSRPRDRDQLRANLRFWATYLYDETGIYPDTTLQPASEPHPPENGSKVPGLSDVINLPGPIDLPRWVAIGGIFVVLLLVILLAVIIPQSRLTKDIQATQVVLQATEEIRENIQVTGIAVLQTSIAMPTTDYSPTPTSHPSITPDLITTVDIRLTEAAGTATAEYTPPATLTATLPISESAYLRPMLIADLENINNLEGCRRGNIEVTFNLNTDDLSERENFQSINVEDFQVTINPLGESAYLPQTVKINMDQKGIASADTSAISANTSYLVRVDHPNVTTSDAIVRFDETCSQNKTLLYHWKDFPSALPTQPPPSDELSLSWKLTTWGPAPQISPSEDTPWVATFTLSASGGDGQYIYWIYRNAQFESLEGNLVSIQSNGACQPVSAVISVASGGLTVVREIVLLSPFCNTKTDH